MPCAHADVFDNWQTLAARKKPEDMLGNNINHPNDFGHWIYFQVFEAMGLCRTQSLHPKVQIGAVYK
jgi:hypothetical protein